MRIFLVSFWTLLALNITAQKVDGDSLVSIAAGYFNENRYEEALNYEFKAANYFQSVGNLRGYSNSLNDMGLYHFLLGKYDSSLIYYRKSLKVESLIGNEYSRVVYRFKNLGITYKNMGNYKDAMSMYRQALELSQLNLDIRQQGFIANELGNLLIHQNQPEKAIVQFRLALIAFSDLDKPDSIAYAKALNNVGNAFLHLKEFDSALYYYHSALNYKSWIPNLRVDLFLNNIGETYMALSQYDSSEFYLQSSLNLKLESGNPHSIALTSNNLAKLYLTLSKLIEVDQYLSLSKSNLSKTTSRDLLAEYYFLRSQLLDSLQRPTEAYEYYRKWNTLQDSLYQAERIEVLSQLADYEKEVVVSEKAIAEKELQLSLNKNQQQAILTRYQWGAITLVSIIAFIIGVLGFRMRKQRNRIHFLLRGFHHGINNHLQIISALLEAQADASDGHISMSLKEVQGRIEAVIGIYRRLYMKNEFQYVNQQAYLEELLDNTALVFGKLNSFQKEVETTVNDMDAEKSIMMGLIVNEVLTNAFKYGLKEFGEPYIKIVLIKQGTDYHLHVSDNGQSAVLPSTSDHSFGMQLIASLSDSLNASYEFQINNGMHFYLNFPSTKNSR